jgi:hypothetical protein
VTSAKYLGATITDKVNWGQHIDSITNKANRTLGFLCRYLKISSISIQDPSTSTRGVCQPCMGSSSSDRHQEAGECTTKGSKDRLK